MTRLALVAALVAAMLAGCAVTPRAPAVQGAQLRDAGELAEWRASGRLAVAVDQQGGSGSFSWQQKSSATELEVRGPLGVGALRIVSDGDTLSVSDAEGRSLDAAAAQEQLRARLGADLPIASLRYWMLGLAAPGSTASVVDAPDAPRRVIEQAGWRVSYDQFTSSQGWWLPARLAAVNGPVRIKVVVDAWQVVSSGAPVQRSP